MTYGWCIPSLSQPSLQSPLFLVGHHKGVITVTFSLFLFFSFQYLVEPDVVVCFLIT
ncbi:putative WD repeat-containing protein 27 isoform X1 [Sesbania bispinosa]|nr:putative WD repeat-containing protein 27 isoform X1 [Sesbania bispinosa]